MEFRALVDDVLDGYFRHYPAAATEAGFHDHDGLWPDLTDGGAAERARWATDALARLQALDPGGLSRDDAIDRHVLEGTLDAIRFAEEELREDRWNPLSYVYLFGGGLFALLARPFAPLPDRLRSAASRLRGLPAALDAARATLKAAGGRPVSELHTRKAVERMEGLADLARSARDEAAGLDDAGLRDEVAAAADEAIGAVEGFIGWLRDDLLPTATGDFRLGADLYDRKFRHALKSDMTSAELEARATEAYAWIRGEMERIARELWPAWIGDETPPEDGGQLTRRVLDAIGQEHPSADELLDYARAENARIEAFVAERDVIGLASEPLQIVWTPEFMRSFGGAMLIPPGPLDRGLESFYAITPMPESWDEARRESYLREFNARFMRVLTIHEAVPGHFLQLAYSNRSSSKVRAIFQSGVFAEGWAVYVTQVMMDVGYGADDPALQLVHWKFFLRAVTNTLMDLRIHRGTMDEAEAMDLMVNGGFQEEGEAIQKWDRARLSSTQLCEYFLGSEEMHGLEREARRRAESEGREFVYRPFLESVLSHGTPPTPVIRDILFGS
jgi:uncharacterized protein (DUF885 family)